MTLPVRSTRPTMPLSRRWGDPFSELEGLYDQMNQLMQSVVGGAGGVVAADVEETDDAFLVDIDLPGVKSEDVDVEVRQNHLRISGEIRERERRGLLRRQSRPVGRFDYVVSVPGDIDPEKVEATLSEGVLNVRLAKSATSRPRHIEVKR